MVLWVDKYRPTQLSKLTLHDNVNHMIEKLVTNQSDFPHLLIYGPSGVGKSVRVACILRQLYGKSSEKKKVIHKSFKVTGKSNKVVEISCISSNHHVEINPSQVGQFNDRFVIQEVIRELAENSNVNAGMGNDKNNNDKPVTTNTPFGPSNTTNTTKMSDGPTASSTATTSSSPRHFKVVVLSEVDCLSLGAQQALRRTMEQFTSNCRLILIANSVTKLIHPLRSRCLLIRIPIPSPQDISSIISAICHRENVRASDEFIDALVTQSCGNVRRAILSLEASRVKSTTVAATSSASSSSSSNQSSGIYVLNDLSLLVRPDWELFIDFIAKLIVEEQSPARLLIVRSKFYELLTNCIPIQIIYRTLIDALLKRCDDTIKCQIVEFAAEYDDRIARGSKPIFHLEAFVAKFMHIYKKWIIENF